MSKATSPLKLSASVAAAAWEVSLTVALSKVSSYERECASFRHKYGQSLETLRAR